MVEEKKVSPDEPARVGVFICHCGSNIGGYIDCKALAEYAGTLPNVVHSEDNLYTCSETGLTAIKDAIDQYDLNRVVVASCTPRTHEPLFRETIMQKGLNPYLFNFVNIRDQCTWVHQKDTEGAFAKAKDVVKMGAAKASKLEPLEKNIVNINPIAMVVGGGISGMTAALSLANQGFKTYLVEKEAELGGLLRSLHTVYPTNIKSSELLGDIVAKVTNHPKIEIHTSSKVIDIHGFVGNYEASIQTGNVTKTVTVGCIVVAVGSQPLKPEGLLGYDGKKRITQMELEKILKDDSLKANDIVMIQCVGARIKERPYCSSVCCMTALKNALNIKEKNPNANITVLFRDYYTPGIDYEEQYRLARDKGIIFLKYSEDKMPTVDDKVVKSFNEFINAEVSIPYDLVVLSTPLVANDDNKELAQLLKVPLEDNKFFLEAHVKLRPIDFATDGVFVCGCAKWPVDIIESISQGYAAASRASTILSHETLEVEGATARLPEVNRDLCSGCEVCTTICPFKAIIKDENGQIQVIQALCKGCGTCVASCTRKALSIKHFTNDQIFAEIHALAGVEQEK
ncbi:MAG: CoB--CoM heterodisulfide reductase iron-sulfur subunit A family protein [Candidatus Hodarchaeota archaeon]